MNRRKIAGAFLFLCGLGIFFFGLSSFHGGGPFSYDLGTADRGETSVPEGYDWPHSGRLEISFGAVLIGGGILLLKDWPKN